MNEAIDLTNLLACLPPWLQGELKNAPLGDAREIRLRAGFPCRLRLLGDEWQGERALNQRELSASAQALSGYTLRTRPEHTRMGFCTLSGGHRMGLCGRVSDGEVCELGSVCIRVARQIPGCADGVMAAITDGGRVKSALITGAPGSGKTTLLRDIARQLSGGGYQVCVADERGEIAACARGVPQLDVGARADVLDGCHKTRAMLWLIRAMCPDVLLTDELGGEEDARAVRKAIACGIPVIATAHDARLAKAPFERAIRLTAPGEPPRLTAIPGAA